MNISPKIIELVLNKCFDTLFFVSICFKYILSIAIPVPPIIMRDIPIKQLNAITIPIIAAKYGKRKKNISQPPL
jgi:hypothetical protein